MVLMHPTGIFTNPYAIEVLQRKKSELVAGIANTDHLLDWLIENGLVSADKRLAVSSYRTREEKNARLLEMLVSRGERACRLFFYPCLKRVEPALYNQIRSYGRSPLHRAAEEGQAEAIRALLAAGAHIYAMDSDSQTPLHLAAPHQSHSAVVKLMLREEGKRADRKSSFLHMAAQRDESGFARTLLRHGAPVDAKDGRRHQTPLFYAVSRGDLPKVVAALAEMGADVNSRDGSGRTPLLMAAERGMAECATVLLEKGAQLRDRAPDLSSALHLAVMSDSPSLYPN
uniref:CARD domain-containing protein n=1 Tax=Callorhinchus milii TaxID=7868 RepID=A0A4W3K6D0_CALMI